MPTVRNLPRNRPRTAVATLVILNVVAFAGESADGMGAIRAFALWPLGAGFAPWQVISYAFLHTGITHLLFNMFGLWMFGGQLERILGSRRLLILYFASVLSAAAMQLLVTYGMNSTYPTLGASGGVFGLLLAYAMIFPHDIIMLLIPPIPLPAWLFVTLYAIIELALGITGTAAGVAHFAHLGGMLGGYLVLRGELASIERE